MRIHHLNCGILHAPPGPQASCHCLLLEDAGRLALVDTGIGLEDVARPDERIGRPAIDAAGFQFHEHLTARRQIERLGFRASDVRDIVLTHADPDHAGGLSDFPEANVHLAAEELAASKSGSQRYSTLQFAHEPRWVSHAPSSERWFDIECRPVTLAVDAEVALLPLFGHTLGHCGVAVRDGDRWLLHVGDACYLRVELSTDDHPVSALATLRAANDAARRQSLAILRRLHDEHGTAIEMFGYHDADELPEFARDGFTTAISTMPPEPRA